MAIVVPDNLSIKASTSTEYFSTTGALGDPSRSCNVAGFIFEDNDDDDDNIFSIGFQRPSTQGSTTASSLKKRPIQIEYFPHQVTRVIQLYFLPLQNIFG